MMTNKKKILLVCSPYYIDITNNLIKGASGQAIQNMNLLFDLPETTGLQLKASYF